MIKRSAIDSTTNITQGWENNHVVKDLQKLEKLFKLSKLPGKQYIADG